MSFLKLVNEQKLHLLKVNKALKKIQDKFEGLTFCLHENTGFSVSIWETDGDTGDCARIIIFDQHSYDYHIRENCKIPPETIEKIIQALVK